MDIGASGHSATTGTIIDTDIVNMANYKKLTYLITLGSTAAANKPTVNVFAGETDTGATAPIVFKYRTQITSTGGTAGGTGSDVSSTMSDTTGGGFAFTTDNNGGMYIIEVDPSTVAAADTTDQTYAHVKLRFTNTSSTATSAAQYYSCLAVLSEPRYPQAILQTAID
ncbi:hypothetical protein ES705_39711 [subsurface metagenome]